MNRKATECLLDWNKKQKCSRTILVESRTAPLLILRNKYSGTSPELVSSQQLNILGKARRPTCPVHTDHSLKMNFHIGPLTINNNHKVRILFFARISSDL